MGRKLSQDSQEIERKRISSVFKLRQSKIVDPEQSYWADENANGEDCAADNDHTEFVLTKLGAEEIVLTQYTYSKKLVRVSDHKPAPAIDQKKRVKFEYLSCFLNE